MIAGLRLLGDDLVGGGNDGVGGGGDGGVDSLDASDSAFLELLFPQAAAQIIIAMTAADINTFFMVVSFY